MRVRIPSGARSVFLGASSVGSESRDSFPTKVTRLRIVAIYTERVAGCCKYPRIVWPREIGAIAFLDTRFTSPRRFALLARAPIPQELPRINSQLVIVVEMKFDRVLAHAFGRKRFDRGLVHRQSPGGKFWRLSRLLVPLGARLVAEGAGAGIAQEGKGIM